MKHHLNATYWDNRYKDEKTGWDLGRISPPLKHYIDQLEDKTVKILIPGAGNSYEAEYLHRQGFLNVYVLDISKTALANFKKRVPDFPEHHCLHTDFFNVKEAFDLIIEQTFFCALTPSLRPAYAKKMAQLLHPSGKLVGVLFGVPLNSDTPPFGGEKAAYLEFFSSLFSIRVLEKCYNSVPERLDKELFMILCPLQPQ
ncbi:SAM-dependent methlyltransferase [Mangrovimonas yunxiaonensis]|uniref:SAM-dependent methlyltransferase n=1 Tax=Mangrovimonas yunxiaonensis TaxID=1197477 RepID=A0A084TJF9_9FLAO|nr:methyltransferase domain-containing protein [Mangrovimonas yunxiaonensis]KFB00845.1 SAM-dependent methlyltransferase [Mangrovimonas yunxiaonensis]GGH44088.1 SAM-dependent methyltransferase [Mangrovimonas yunxiaonensis]